MATNEHKQPPAWLQQAAAALESMLQQGVKLEMHGPEARAMLDIFEAISAGGTLVLCGPDATLQRRNGPKYSASLESADELRNADAYADQLGEVLVALAAEWRSPESMQQRPAVLVPAQASPQRCDCGLQLGQVSGIVGAFCIRCDAGRLNELTMDVDLVVIR
jgi:hypothetical protein